jgi:oligopeptide/dipeptide ABC transporter ATP-binding protein
MITEKPLVSINNLSVRFNTSRGIVSAVEGVNFSIGKKEIFALVGESGCGKSTTAYALMRLISEPGEITGGNIIFQDQDLLSLSQKEMVNIRGKKISMIFQNPLDSLNPVIRIRSQVSEAIVLDKIPKKEAWEKAVEIIKEVKIPDPAERADSYPFELSGGMRQRVMIGMMISRKPELLIADEPTTALDVTIQAQILEIIKELKEEIGTSILLITHDFGIVAEISDRIAVMYAGKIVEIGDVFQIFERPCHPYTKLLMGSLPRINKKEGRLNTIFGSVPNLINPPKGCRFHDRCPYSNKECHKIEPKMVEIEKGHLCACNIMRK